MHLLRRVLSELLRQFRLNQIRFSDKTKIAEQTESDQHLTDEDIETFHDVDLCSDLSILMNVKQHDGKALPIFSFTEHQIAEKCKKFTNLDPVALTLMGLHDVILEFDKKDDITVVLMRAHGCHQWDEVGVNIHCIAAPKVRLLKIYEDIEKRKKETQMLERERDILQKEKRQYKDHLSTDIKQMSAKLDRLDKKFDEGPSILSGVVTPEQIHELASPRGEQQQILVSAPSLQLVMLSGLPLFSGSDPTLRDESTYEQWKFQVKGMRSSCPESTVRSSLITSVWGEASELVSFLGFNAPLETLLDVMEDRFGRKITGDWLQQEFYQLQQERREKVQHFAVRLEKAFKKLQEAFPDRYQRNQLKEHLFHSVNQQTRDSMRYLYDRESTTYEVLLAAMKKAETEWSKTHAQFRMKGAAVVQKKKLDELKERLNKLQATVKSATAKAEKDKKKTLKTSPRKDDPRKATQGPHTSSAGPFRPDQKPMQCFKCEGWGHGWRECVTKGNVDWGRVHGDPAPTVQDTPKPEQQ